MPVHDTLLWNVHARRRMLNVARRTRKRRGRDAVASPFPSKSGLRPKVLLSSRRRSPGCEGYTRARACTSRASDLQTRAPVGTFYLTVPTFTFATRTNGRTPDAYDEPPPTTLSLSFSFNLSLFLPLFPPFLFFPLPFRPSFSSRCASTHARCLYCDCLAVHTYARQPYKSRICRVTYIRESAFYVGIYMRKDLNRAFEIWSVTPGCRALEPVTVLPQFRPQSQNTVSRGRVRREPLDCTKK